MFSLLERDFTSNDIQRAVATSLAPPTMRSIRSPNAAAIGQNAGWEDATGDNKLRSPLRRRGDDGGVYRPPHLPLLSRYDELNGIIYLHGRVNDDYSGADGDSFVLSSAEFGHAYLSEGWATEFFREIVRGYVVVFVGYSADDPPVSYLLEGLRRQTNAQHHIYAFQSVEATELIARWEHKGVIPIGYSPADGHRALWDTLAQWAVRRRPQDWQRSVLNRVTAGPRQHQPYERGQVAHIVSTYEGAKAFAEAKPPAEWLCVFDPACRYEPSGTAELDGGGESESRTVFAVPVDSDAVPQRSDSEVYSRMQSAPADAWDAFTMNGGDREGLSRENFAAARGASSSSVPRLPNRLACFGGWIADVANQPAAVWWAARQLSLHPAYRKTIAWALTRTDTEIDRDLRRVWQYILEQWEVDPAGSRSDWSDSWNR